MQQKEVCSFCVSIPHSVKSSFQISVRDSPGLHTANRGAGFVLPVGTSQVDSTGEMGQSTTSKDRQLGKKHPAYSKEWVFLIRQGCACFLSLSLSLSKTFRIELDLKVTFQIVTF